VKCGVLSPFTSSAEDKERIKLYVYSPSGRLEGKFYYYLGVLFCNISMIYITIWNFYVMNKEICSFK